MTRPGRRGGVESTYDGRVGALAAVGERRGPRGFAAAALAVALALAAASHAAAEAPPTSVTGSVRVLQKGSDRPHESFADAVVWLSGTTAPAPVAPVTINQLDKKFRPRVLPVVKGQVVHFLNQDPIEHNVFSTDSRNRFDLGRYPKSEYRPVTFDTPGVFKVYCNIHKAMILDVVVLESQHFAVTGEGGVFSIEAVPPGAYQLNVWHIYGGTHTQPIEVAGEPLSLEPIAIRSTRVVRQVEDHLDKDGRRYKKKHSYIRH